MQSHARVRVFLCERLQIALTLVFFSVEVTILSKHLAILNSRDTACVRIMYSAFLITLNSQCPEELILTNVLTDV